MPDVEDEVSLVIDSNVIKSSRSLLKKHSLYFEAMFRDEFIEKLKSQITLHDIDYPSFNLILEAVSTGEPIKFTSSNVYEITRISGMLQFVKMQEQCANYIKDSLKFSNALEIMFEMGSIGETELQLLAKKFVRCYFGKCCTYGLQYVRELSPSDLKEFVNSELILVDKEIEVFFIIRDWIMFSQERSVFILELLSCIRMMDLRHEERYQVMRSDVVQRLSKEDHYQLLSMQNKPRRPPIYPCVVGYVRKESKQFEANSYRRQRDSSLFMFDPVTKSLSTLVTLEKINDGTCEATGYKVLSHGHNVIISGGEFTIGRNKWNKDIWSYNTITSRWVEVNSLIDPQRHHSVCSIGDKLYLIGGYGKHRCVLDSVIVVDLESSDVQTLEPLPVPMNSPAVCSYGGRFIYVFKSEVCVYDVTNDSWSRLAAINMPKNVEFCNALCFENTIYLTSAHSHELYAFRPNQDNSIRFIGKFFFEVQNVCLVRGIIYSFTSDQFDCKSYIESYNCRTNEFAQLWEERSEKIDFSPYFSFGCFPLLIHKD